jgi:esterase/lipase
MTRPLLPLVGIAILGLCGCGQGDNPSAVHQFPVTTIPAKQPPYLEQRATFQSKLLRKGPSPQLLPMPKTIPEGVQVVEYPSGKLLLKAWLAIPEETEKTKKPFPALVYFHGGFAFTSRDFENCLPFLEAGFVVLCPTFRGENGNPGHFEMWYGEVDDARAAVKWLAQQPYVDRERVYVFGHHIGGGIAALLSLFDDVPIQHGGSSGGLYNAKEFVQWVNILPFDRGRPEEYEMRLLLGHLRDMKHRHYAYLGTTDPLQRSKEFAEKEMAEVSHRLEIIDIEGDHATSLDAALEAYRKRIADEMNRPKS